MTSFSLLLIRDIIVDKSEPLTEPDTMTPSEFGKHLASNFSIRAFHIKKQSYFLLFENRGLKINISSIDKGVLNLRTLNDSIKN